MKYTVKIIGHLRTDGTLLEWNLPTLCNVETKTPRAAAQKALDSLHSGGNRLICEVEGKRYLGTPIRKMRVTSWKGEV